MTASSLLVNQSTLLTFTAYEDGDATDIGTITIGIVDANGDTVVASGTAVTDNSDGTYEYSLTAQTETNLLIITWTEAGGTAFTTYLDVQGSQLFNEAQLRAFDDGEIADTNLYTDADIAQTHQRVAEFMEAFTGRSWIRRYARKTLPGSGSRFLDVSEGHPRTSGGLWLNRPGANNDILTIIRANDGAAITTSNIVILGGPILQRTDAAWTKTSSTDPLNVTVEYEYGQPFPVDGADRIAMMIARHMLVSSRIPDNASSFNDALGNFAFDETRLPFEAYQWLKNHKVSGFFA